MTHGGPHEATKQGQLLVWDSAQSGLCVVIGMHTKTLRSNYQLHGRWRARSIGRFMK